MELDEKVNEACDSHFLDHVLSWSVHDILDDSFFKSEIKKIPDTFQSTTEYFESFLIPLLEETRTELCSNLSSVSSADFAAVISIDKANFGSSQLYHIKVDRWRTSDNNWDYTRHKVSPGDVFALMESESSANPVFQSGQKCVFVSAVEFSKEFDDSSSLMSVKVKASKDVDHYSLNKCSLFMVYLSNVSQFERIWNALHKRDNLKLIEKVLHSPPLDVGVGDCDCLQTDHSSTCNLGSRILSNLNLSQESAITASLQNIQCRHKPSVGLIWGPPGTGKTKTISSLLCVLVKMNCRTLACAPTNVAISTLAFHVVQLLKESSFRCSGYEFCSLGSILLFGSKDRLSVGSDIQDIFLDYRVKRLSEVFSPPNGWSGSFYSLLDFFEDVASKCNNAILNKAALSRKHGNCLIRGSVHPRFFLHLGLDRFVSMAEDVRRSISVLCTHIPRSFILECNYQNLMLLLDLLNGFECLISQDEDQVLRPSHCGNGVCECAVYTLRLLENKSKECGSLLKNMCIALGELQFPRVTEKNSVVDFCIQMASSFFCTASSSHKLYSLPMEPLDVLIVDEAAQLKECEGTIPLQLHGLRHAILVGDEYQLPAVVKSHHSSCAGFGRSMFQRLSLLGWSKHLLNMQYRMHLSISAFPRQQFYGNLICDAPNVQSDSHQRRYLEGSLFGPYSFINIAEGREESDQGASKRNMVEAAVVCNIVLKLYKAWRLSTFGRKLSVGVISPYSAQVHAIEDILGHRFGGLEDFTVKVKSVDGFQGAEEDVILISTARSNSTGETGFTSNPQRLNVALTRARYCLWVVGNAETLIKKKSIWDALVTDAKERNCYHNASEDDSIVQAIINVKKELGEMDDLLNTNSLLFKNARWKVLFSNDFLRSFSKLHLGTKKYVMTLLLKLSNGWRPRRIRVDPVCESTIQIAKQFKVLGLYVVCTVDIVKELKYVQVLRIWDVLPLDAVPQLVKKVDRIYEAFTEEYVSCCRERRNEGNMELPVSWSSSPDIVRYKSFSSEESTSISHINDEGASSSVSSKAKESLMLMKFYSLSAGGVRHLLSVSDGRPLDLPFEVTESEWQIINYGRSCFILGRSGTGKTTVLVMKLFQKEEAYKMAQEGPYGVERDAYLCDSPAKIEDKGEALRQVFITVNPVLCQTVKQQIINLQRYVRGENMTKETYSIPADDMELLKDIPDSFLGISAASYPLVITLNKFLFMLDGSVGASYFSRFSETKKASVVEVGTGSSRSVSLQSLMEMKEVSYNKFRNFYWPHLNSVLTKNFDPLRAFTEIMSCIKGGIQVGKFEESRCSLDSYLQLSEGRISSLGRTERQVMYEIFLNYEKMKLKRREFDLADLVNDLHLRLYHEKYDGDKLDFVYVDEVQDLTMRQIALFKYICKNVEDGYVFAGDTAQTIAKGVDFRFQDIRCLFYNEFLQGLKNVEVGKRQEKGKSCPIFHLSQNFRSHSGNVKLADSVVRLIYHFFPHSIDTLSPEYSLIEGQCPCLLYSRNDDNVILRTFQSIENGGNCISFGAEQVILVRDESSRVETENLVKGRALVLTIFQCKGLEFKDVLLYKFFSSSPNKDHWNVIYEYMRDKNLVSELPHFPDFCNAKHSGICRELKELYVALTRAKERLWICEDHGLLSEPMANYWKKLNLVQPREFTDAFATEMVVCSSKEDWKLRGLKLLEVSNFEAAAFCFERAGEQYWEKYARAACLRVKAVSVEGLKSEAAVMLIDAAGMFESIGNMTEAAKCFYDAGSYKRAGDIYLQCCGEAELVRAAHCYTLARCFSLAAEAYVKGRLFSECLRSCREGGLFKLGLQYIRSWKLQDNLKLDLISSEQEFLELCAREYKNIDKGKMMKYVKEFCSLESMRTFLRTSYCYDELLELEIEFGNLQEAIEIARKIGNVYAKQIF